MTRNRFGKLAAALLGSALLVLAGAAHAGHSHGHDRTWHKGHKGHHSAKAHVKPRHVRHSHPKHWKHAAPYREKVVIREYVAPHREVHHHHYHPAPVASYHTTPAVVIGFDIPPIVIPLR